MKPNKDREELERNLNLVLQDCAIEKDKMRNVAEKLKIKHDIPNSERIVWGQIPLKTQEPVLLYYLSKYLFEEFDTMLINPNEYFTDNEISEFTNFRMIQNQKFKNQVVFEGFRQIQSDIYSGEMTIKDIAELFRYGIADYNIKTQRNTTVTKLHGKVIEEITLNKNSVSDISKAIRDRSYIPISPVVFNILKDGTEDYKYDQNKDRLILIEGELNCTDGFHRSMAMVDVLDNEASVDILNYKFPVVITHFTVEKARNMISQEGKKNEMSKEYLKSLKSGNDNLENYIIDELQQSNELKGKITTNIDAIKLNAALVTHEVLELAISENFEYEDRRDARKIYEYLIDGFIEIMGIFKNEFKDLEKTKEDTVIANNLMFVGYIALLAELKNKNRWRTVLEDVLESIDFTVSNPTWQEIGIMANKINRSRIKKISKYFRNLVEESEKNAG